MGRERRATELVQRVGQIALKLLRAQDHVSREEMARQSSASPETVKRALDWLRNQGAPIEYEPGPRAWRLCNRSFSLPLSQPSLEDLQAALTAAGLLDALGQVAAAGRAWSLFDELDLRLHGGRGRGLRRDALRVTQSTAVVREPRWLLVLLRAVRRKVIQVHYRSPWTNDATTHSFEPWQVWLHDGVPYVRGYSRTRKAPRTFRLAGIESLAVLDAESPNAAVPESTNIWGGGDPKLGIDEDRPDMATIRFRGGVARWVSGAIWHPMQKDVWLDDKTVLERSVPYRSCREFARRLVAVGDGIESVAPAELRDEVYRIAQEAIRNLG